MIKRAISYVVILISILFLPYWLYVPIIVAATVIIPFFWEAIIFGFLIDVLYGSSTKFSVFFVSVHSLAATIIIIAAMIFKEKLRFHV